MDKLKSYLKKNNFSYKIEQENTVIVNLDFGLYCRIKVKKDESIEITGHLRAWNFATGIVHLNMKWLMTYNLVSLFVVLGIIMFLKEETFSSPFFYDFFFLWILLSNLYYIIKFYHFKTLVHLWWK